MNKESFSKKEIVESHETPQKIEESAFKLMGQMQEQAEKETSAFIGDGDREYKSLNERAEKDGFVIDNIDKLELEDVLKMAGAAKKDLDDEIAAINKLVTPPPLPKEYLRQFQQEQISSESLPVTPPPIPEEYLRQFSQEKGQTSEESSVTPPPLPEEYLRQNMPVTPPPLPEEYLQKYPMTQDSLPNTPPPLPDQYLEQFKTTTSFESEKEAVNAEFFAPYLKKSRIDDKALALQRIMQYVGAQTLEEFKAKLSEKDEYGDNKIESDLTLFTPDNLRSLRNPSIETLKKILEVGNALGYTYLNTPDYKNSVDDVIDKCISRGEIEKAREVEKVFDELLSDFEKEKEKSQFEKIDDNLVRLTIDHEKLARYVEEVKNLPPDAMVDLYHGLNSGEYDAALAILDSPQKGLEQRSGPCVSLTPVGSFWKGVGFKYSLRRDQIQFPGEEKPNAVIKMENGPSGIPDAGIIVNEIGGLPLDQFEAKIMRSKFTLPNPELEKKLAEKLSNFADLRKEIGQK